MAKHPKRPKRPRGPCRPGLATDGFPFYVGGIQRIFGNDIDHATLVKLYANVPSTTRYAPLKVTDTKREPSPAILIWTAPAHHTLNARI